MLRIFGTWLLLAGLVTSPAPAQAPLTLADAIARAREHSPDAGSSAAAAREAAERVTQTRAAFLPRVDLTESWQRSDQPVFVFSSLLSQRRFTIANFAIDALNHPDAIDNFRTAIVAEQPLLNAASHSALGAATIGQQIAEARRAQVAQDLAVAVTAAFGRALTAMEARKSAAAALESARADRELAANRRDAGLATDADVLTLEVFAARAHEQEIRATADERTARAELNVLMGEPLAAVFALDPHAVAAAIDTADLAALETEALGHRPEVTIAALEERLGTAGVDGARAAYLPTVSAQGGWEFNGGTWTDRTSSWMVGALARVNLFRGFADKARLAEARQHVIRLSQERRKAEDSARVDVYAAAARLDAARASVTVGRAAAAQARESRRIVRDRYDTGLADVTALLRATESVVQAEAQQASAEVGVLIATAALERALGRQ
jgi:outer membrane protein TolC